MIDFDQTAYQPPVPDMQLVQADFTLMQPRGGTPNFFCMTYFMCHRIFCGCKFYHMWKYWNWWENMYWSHCAECWPSVFQHDRYFIRVAWGPSKCTASLSLLQEISKALLISVLMILLYPGNITYLQLSPLAF